MKSYPRDFKNRLDKYLTDMVSPVVGKGDGQDNL